MAEPQPRRQIDHRLRVVMDEQGHGIRIEGNKSGLEFLAATCLHIIGQPPGSSAWHLSEAFSTLDRDSMELYVSYRKELER